jgi:hypothetical protein
MSVTFSGAFTFDGGGLTLTLPPSQPTASWAAGGYPPLTRSTVNRITYATDTATASIRGPLVGNNEAAAGTGTMTYGWFGGGYTASGYISRIERITFATDTATATARSTLSNSPGGLAASSDTTTYGWFAGGDVGGPAGSGNRSTVQRLTFATDTAGTTSKGPLSQARSQFNGMGTSSYGWFGGGSVPASVSTVDRIDYANDTATASVRGALTSAVYGAAASSDGTTYGYYIAGIPYTSVTQRVTFATDTATTTTRGPYFASIYGGSGSGNDTYGYVTAANAGSPISTVGRITYATDTATASERGPMTYAAFNVASTAGIQ